jgi:outer membrane protein assembly factor BamB
MPVSPSDHRDHPDPTLDLQVARVLQDWIDRQAEGDAESPEDLIAKHPDLDPELTACLESIAMLDSAQSIASLARRPFGPQIPDFEIVGEIGRGGMGIVYEAQQKSLDRIVALKVLPLATADPLAAARFQREAETAAALHHTNIVPIYAVGQASGIHWFAMQRIDGIPLDDLLRTQPDGVDSDEVARIGIEAADALAHAHRCGVVHRDIKPSNLMIEPSGRVWLADFGLARRELDVTATASGALLGTPRYMSPEQVYGSPDRPLDSRGDIYSLGATLYEIATGTVLFDGATPLDVLQQIRTADPPRPRSVRPGMPRDLEVVLQKCLAKDPAERYQLAEDLASDLRAIREGRAIKARGVPLWTVLRRRAARHQQRIKLAATAISATALFILVGTLLWNQYTTSRQGSLMVTAAGGPFVASIHRVSEVGRADPEPVVTTTVPMQRPLDLDASEYIMQLAGDGKFSESVQFAVAAGEAQSLRYVDRRPAPIEIEIQEQWTDVLNASDGSQYLSTLNGQNWSVYGSGGRSIFDLPVEAISADEAAVDFSYRIDDPWMGNRNATRPNFARPQRVMTQPIDLDDDQKVDFVITARSAPVAAAFDQNGQRLWATRLDLPWHETIPPPPTVNRKGEPWNLPFIFEVLPLDDLDDDGTNDLVFSVSQINPQRGTVPFLVTVSGRSGTVLTVIPLPIVTASPTLSTWPAQGKLRYPSRKADEQRNPRHLTQFRGEFLRRNNSANENRILWSETSIASTFPVTPRIHLVEHNGLAVAVTVTGNSIDTWDLVGGQRVGQTQTLPFEIASRPIAVRLGPDKPPGLMIWSASPTQNSGMPSRRAALIVLGQPEPLWDRRLDVRWDLLSMGQEASDLPLASDLDGDGVDEIIVSTFDESVDWLDGGHVDCLDAGTGLSKWKRSLEVKSTELLIERGVAVDDLDGDNVRDVAIISTSGRSMGDTNWASNKQAAHFWVYLDIVSGADGSHLSWQRVPVRVVADVGHIFDIDSIGYQPKSKPHVVSASIVHGDVNDPLLDSMTIRFDLTDHTAPEIAYGITRLSPTNDVFAGGFYRQRPGSDQFFRDVAIWLDEQQPTPYRADATAVLAQWQDAQGRPRLLLNSRSNRHVHAIDSDSGHAVWSHSHTPGLAQAFPVFDERAGGGDIVLQVAQRQAAKPIVLDAHTGRIRCTIPIELGDILRVDRCDDDDSGDAAIMILASTHFRQWNYSPAQSSLVLLKADRLTGQVIWKTQFFSNMPNHIVHHPIFNVLRVDCNNDGVDDIVTSADGAETSLALAAISGVDGRFLWQQDLDLRSDRWSNEIPWPPMTWTGPAASRRIIVLDSEGSKSYALKMISAAGGQLIDKLALDANYDHVRSGDFHLRGFGRLELQRFGSPQSWPALVVAHPKRQAGSTSTQKSWLSVGTSADGFAEPIEIARQPSIRSTWIALDEQPDGEVKRLEVTNDGFRCLQGDRVLYERRFESGVQYDRIHHVNGGPDMLGLLIGKKSTYTLFDVATGSQRYRSDVPGADFSSDQYNPASTPLLQSTTESKHLVRSTRQGVRIIPLADFVEHEQRPMVNHSLALRSDPRESKRLPSSPLWGGLTLGSLLVSTALGTMLSYFALFLPLGYVVRLLRDQSWTLRYLLMSPVVAVISLLTWQYLLDPARTVSIDPNENTPWPIVLFGGAIGVAAIAFVIRAIRRRNYVAPGIALLIAAALTTLSIAVPVLQGMIADGAGQYRWGLDDVAAMMMLFSINVMMFGYLIWNAISVLISLFRFKLFPNASVTAQ